MFRRSAYIAQSEMIFTVSLSKSAVVESARGTAAVYSVERKTPDRGMISLSDTTSGASYIIETEIGEVRSTFQVEISKDTDGAPAVLVLRDPISDTAASFNFNTQAVSCPSTGFCLSNCALGKICSSLNVCEMGLLGFEIGTCFAGNLPACADVATELAKAALCYGVDCTLQCSSSKPSGCTHTECTAGAALASSCSSCAATVCKSDSYCCNSGWDSVCVNEAKQLCGNTCGSGGNPTPPPSSCTHSACTQGIALTKTCSTCATTVCNKDNYCCTNSWDGICVSEAKQWCGTVCP